MLIYKRKLALLFKLSKHNLGFTLIEVLISLMILSITVTTLSSAVSQSTNNVSFLKQKQFANWVAHNQMSLFLLGDKSETQGKKRFAGIDFIWAIQKSETQTKNFNKITLNVTSPNKDNYTLATITAFQGTQ